MPSIKVIGESCQDIFVYCEASRLAPDLPVPILHEKYQESNPGMAANVHRNIRTKHANCELLTNMNWERSTKTRYVHERTNHTFFRIDSPQITLGADISMIDLKADIIVISDYDKGFLSKQDIEFICSLDSVVFLDTKKKLGEWAKGADFIKINDFEFSRSEPFITEELRQKIIRTLGGQGCEFQGVTYPVEKVNIGDTSGAGDSFLAALVCAYINSGDIIESIKYANESASRIVRSRGVGVI